MRILTIKRVIYLCFRYRHPVKDMSDVQKVFIHALWEDGKYQKEIAVQIRCCQCATSNIKRTSSKRFNCGSNPKISISDERQLHKILISNRFTTCCEISEV